MKVSASQAIQGTGSVWNSNSYHWEEKNVNAWAEDTIKKSLSGFTFSMNDMTLSVIEITNLKGEAGSSVRKGKKIITFEYEIKLKWKCELSSGNQCTGEYYMPEFSNDDDEDGWEVRTTFLEDKDNMRQFAE